MDNDFVTWVMKEYQARGWTSSELARRAELSAPTISNVLNRHKNPGVDFCTGIARAFKLPHEEVFRRAGLLPPLPSPENDFTELLSYMKRLSPAQQDDVLRYVKFQYQQG